VPILYDRRLQDLYLPTTSSGAEYPNLLAPDEKIETVATSVLLVTFNWPEKSERYRRTAKFVDAAMGSRSLAKFLPAIPATTARSRPCSIV
jgi:uncharacterized protein